MWSKSNFDRVVMSMDVIEIHEWFGKLSVQIFCLCVITPYREGKQVGALGPDPLICESLLTY